MDLQRKWVLDRTGGMFSSPSATVNGLSVKAPLADVPQLAQTFVFDTVGSVVLRPPVATGLRLGPLQAMLILSYAMSMVARYRPSAWMAVLSGTGSDRFFPFVEAFLDFNEAWFPVLVADHLQRLGDCDYSMLPGTLPT